MNQPIYKIGAIVRPKSPELKDSCVEIFRILAESGIEVWCERESSCMLGLQGGVGFEEILDSADAILSIGGDGTLISAVRKSIGSNLPIFGINMGSLGFLTAIKPNEVASFASLLVSGGYKLDFHCMLEARFVDSSEKFYALNEVFITKNNHCGMIKVGAKINNEFFNTYIVDGLIIATPTGSSAYNISAGGSVVYPFCSNILLTPVCAHSLTQRPLVISDDLELEFVLKEDGMILIDGQQTITFHKNKTLNVRKSCNIPLIQHPNRSYFAVLKEKFNWGGGS
ncbi:NAD(+)/NADH kinase [Helicobacter fennelliae]|uniref:NAD(+)/NADH kinase n=1 Tax=Helicobacter fennelliae TaxID=215 RepID=UPI000E013B5B|nr:NAD(+)/NADH kinase [Helicobacter fennelliae]STQ83422.1 NAD kinase [Helicobacter fennelliae]